MEKSWFRLGEKTLLVHGASRGALYNLGDEKIYSIDPIAVKFINLCEQGLELSKIFEENSDFNSDESLAYLDKLVQFQLGKYCGPDESRQKILLDSNNDDLRFAWLELIEGCNLECLHCYGDGNPILIEEGVSTFSNDDWEMVLRQIAGIGCKKVQFTGGEPLLLGGRLISLIEYANSLGFSFIEVFTNTTLLTNEMLDAFVKNKVNVAVSFYSNNQDTHELVTRKKGSFLKAVQNIERIVCAGLELRISVTIMKQNQDTVDSTKAFLKEKFGLCNIRTDIVRPSGRGRNSEIMPDKFLVSEVSSDKQKSFSCSEKAFSRMIQGHNCFLNKICIGANGAIRPCIMERKITYGNVLEAPLSVILGGNFSQNIRHLSKDKIDICKDCEYRYACFDCRVKASKDGNIFAKPSDCYYNPYTGQWNSY